MKTISVALLVMFLCAGCREETTNVCRAQVTSSTNRKSDERVSAIEQEMSKMSQKLAGDGWETMLWGCDLIKAIMALDERDERIRLMNRYMDSLLQLKPYLEVKHKYSLALRNYEELIGTCTIFKNEPEIAERILGIMCDCIRMHRKEVKKWADAIDNEPNRRNRVPLKNIYRGLDSDYMMFTNHVERTYFPRMKSHGLPPDRHEYWRRQISDAYESQRRTEANIREHRKQEEANGKREGRVSAIEQEMTNMPQKLTGDGWETMLWGNNLARAIMALDNRDERMRLMNRYMDSLLQLKPSLEVKHKYSLAFRNYEELIGTCTIFEGEPEIAERILRIMCDCIRMHRKEVKKWADAIDNEPNRRNRVPLKNIYRGLDSDYMMFTNEAERTYFPWMKSHGLPPDRHEYWRHQIDAAYEMKESK